MDSLRRTVDFFFKGVNSVVGEADHGESFSVYSYFIIPML